MEEGNGVEVVELSDEDSEETSTLLAEVGQSGMRNRHG